MVGRKYEAWPADWSTWTQLSQQKPSVYGRACTRSTYDHANLLCLADNHESSWVEVQYSACFAPTEVAEVAEIHYQQPHLAAIVVQFKSYRTSNSIKPTTVWLGNGQYWAKGMQPWPRQWFWDGSHFRVGFGWLFLTITPLSATRKSARIKSWTGKS